MDKSTENLLATSNLCSVNHNESYTVNHSPHEHLRFNARCSDFELNCVGLFDPGSSDSLMPASLLPQAILDKLGKTDRTFRGIANTVFGSTGKFTATISICGTEIPDIDFYVLPIQTPILLGQNIWHHPSVTGYHVDVKKNKFTLSFGERGFGETEIAPGPYRLMHRIHNVQQVDDADGFISDEDDDYLPPEIVPKTDPSHLRTLTKKIEWLQTELGIKLEHEDTTELETFADLLIEHKAVFGVGAKNLGKFPKSVKIPTNGESRSSKFNHIAQAHKDLVATEIDKMLAAGVIEECKDPRGFNSAIVVVKKKDGSLRVCLNFKNTLNQVLAEPDPYPMQSTDQVFAKITPGKKYLTGIDLIKGYWHVMLDPEDRHKTAFTFEGKTYQFCRLPFGLSTAGNTFSRVLAEILQDCLRQSDDISIYLDDITIHSDNFDDFINAHRRVFQALIDNGGLLKPSKCDFLKKQVKFLGRIISADGVAPDPDHVQGIIDLKPPKTKRQLASLVGRLTWMNQFIGTRMHEKVKTNSYSHLMEEIYNLYRRQDKKFVWTDAAGKAFEAIKKRLASAPFISFADPNEPFTLTTDASCYGAAGVLMQQRNGRYHVIACISKTFSPVQRRWSATEREAFAICWAVQKLSHFLLDRSFTVFSDHKSLQYIDRREFSNPKIQNWQHRLSRYRFTVQYLEGAENIFADWLSRTDDIPKREPCDDTAAGQFYKLENSQLRVYIPSWCSDLSYNGELKLELDESPRRKCAHVAPAAFLCESENADETRLLRYLELTKAQREDPFLSKIVSELDLPLSKSASGKNRPLVDVMNKNSEKYKFYKNLADDLYLDPGSNILMVRRKGRNPQMVVPQSLRKYYLHAAHNNCGHNGQTRMAETLQDFIWEGKLDDIELYVKSCTDCANRKGRYGKRKIPNGHNLRGSYPFQCVYIDYICMPNARGHKYALTLLCSFTKFLEVYPVANDSAKNTARCLVQMILKHRTIPEIISCDRGRHFTGELFTECCNQLGIKLNFHVAWRPQSTGCLERAHRTLKNSLFIMARERNSNWLDLLPFVVSALNASPNSATKTTPHFAVFGRHPKMDLPLAPDKNLSANSPLEFGLLASECARRAYKLIEFSNRAADLRLDEKIAKTSSESDLRVGHKVCIYRPQAASNTDRMPWHGEYEILDTNGLVSKIVGEGKPPDWVHNVHLRRIYDKPEEFTISEPLKVKIYPPDAKVLSPGRGEEPSPPSKPPQAIPKPSGKRKIAKPLPSTNPPQRASGRNRKQVQRLSVDPSKKSYANSKS